MDKVVYDRIDALEAELSGMQIKIEELQRSLPQNIRPSKSIKARSANIALGSNNVVIANVTGKGTLYHALATHPYNWHVATNIIVKIVIDGKTIQCGGNRSNTNTCSIGFLTKDCIITCGDAGNTVQANVWLENFVYAGETGDYPNLSVSDPFVKIYEADNITEGNVILYSEYGLKFENSLVVTVSNIAVNDRDTACEASVLYVLED